MNIDQVVLVLLFTAMFVIVWRCTRTVSSKPEKLPAAPAHMTATTEANSFLEDMWEDMSRQSDPTVPGSQAWLAQMNNDPTNVGSTAWLLAQSVWVPQDLPDHFHAHDDLAHHHSEWHHHHDHEWTPQLDHDL